MYLDKITANDLAGMLILHMAKPAWPGLDDPKARDKARAVAKRCGMWDNLTRNFDLGKFPPVLRRSVQRRARATGALAEYGGIFSQWRSSLDNAGLAVWLGHPSGEIEYLEDILWAWCDASHWIHAAHGDTVGADLHTSHLAANMSEIVFMLRDRLDAEVCARVEAAVEAKALRPAVDYRKFNWWHTGTNNWNHVILCNLMTAAFYLLKDPHTLSFYLHPLIENLKYGLAGYAEDGGCTEGPDYWSYGFIHYLQAAVMLLQRTGGMLDIVHGYPKVERICRYPLANHIDGRIRACWGDSYHGNLPYAGAVLINRFFKLPELFGLCDPKAPAAYMPAWRGLLQVEKMPAIRTDELYKDALLPDLGSVKLYAAARSKSKPVALAAVAGNNGFNHNHNDIGSFIYYRNGVCLFTDPGFPTYTIQCFSPKRYECIYNGSQGHSVPLIDGQGEHEGAEYKGEMAVTGMNGQGEKIVAIEMAKAYAVKKLQGLKRVFRLAPGGALTMTDSFRFSRKPKTLVEQFITYECAALLGKGRAVRIGKGKQAVTLAATGGRGVFRIECLTEESKQGRGQGVITRIRFYPARMAGDMELAFRVE